MGHRELTCVDAYERDDLGGDSRALFVERQEFSLRPTVEHAAEVYYRFDANVGGCCSCREAPASVFQACAPTMTMLALRAAPFSPRWQSTISLTFTTACRLSWKKKPIMIGFLWKPEEMKRRLCCSTAISMMHWCFIGSTVRSATADTKERTPRNQF